MKRILILLLLLCIACIAFATPSPALKQSKYRWRNNNGNETTATWKAAENTAITLTSMSEIIRFRGEYYCTGAASDIGHYLSYSKNGGTTWTQISESAANDFMMVTTTEVAHGAATTNQLGTSTGGTYVAGKVISQNTPSMLLNLAVSSRAEMEWVIKPTSSVQNNTTYLFENRSINTLGVQGQLTTNFACAVPTITVVPGFRRCGSGTLQLSATASPASSTITWWTAATGGTNIGTGATTTSPVYTANTTVYVQAQNSTCVSARTAVELTIEQVSLAIDNADGSHCLDGNMLELTTSPAYPNTYTYLWSTNATTPAINAGLSNGTAVTYWVQVTSPSGCVKRDTVNLTLNPKPKVDLGSDTIICPNALMTLDADNTGATYLWNTGAQTQTLEVGPGTYSVQVTNMYDCSNGDEIVIDAIEAAAVSGFTFVPRFDIEPGRVDFAPLNNVAVDSYLWDFGDGNTSTMMHAQHTYNTTGIYEVKLTVSNSCGSMDTILKIHVDRFTGISLVDEQVAINMYPVPAQSKLTVESPAAGVYIQSLSIINTAGREMIVTHEINKPQYVQDISTLANGHYMVHIKTNKGERVMKISILK
ncbi:MAG: hypothetical protein BGO31_16805 [Bacteroidetes bacterium 43-16]|nr:MAG: hypothetical protein BGO31_16805 [Bacteroidetes bacterium 43-16]